MNVREWKSTLHNVWKKGVESVTPTPTVSKFDEKRILTPQEFVKAGDYLVRAFPTWEWAGGAPRKRQAFLPHNKQYLVTRKVPVRKLQGYDGEDQMVEGDDDQDEGWMTPALPQTGVTESVPTMTAEEDIPVMTEEPEQEAEDEGALPSRVQASTSEGIVQRRKYDLYISYDLYYQVPRFWLVGFSEDNQPLPADEIFEDVTHEHVRNTVTSEAHPHENFRAMSIHPCRHASVMKKLGDRMVASGKEFTVEHYLVVFLKFITSIIPTIEYDYTMSGSL